MWFDWQRFGVGCMISAALGIVLLALTACATPRERVVVREVKVPIPVACAVTVPARPAYAAGAVSLDGSIFDLVQALLIEREARKAREAELEAVAKACS